MDIIKNQQSMALAVIACISPLLPASCTIKQDKPDNKRPNIVFIFADDMGYGDVSLLNPDIPY